MKGFKRSVVVAQHLQGQRGTLQASGMAPLHEDSPREAPDLSPEPTSPPDQTRKDSGDTYTTAPPAFPNKSILASPPPSSSPMVQDPSSSNSPPDQSPSKPPPALRRTLSSVSGDSVSREAKRLRFTALTAVRSTTARVEDEEYFYPGTPDDVEKGRRSRASEPGTPNFSET